MWWLIAGGAIAERFTECDFSIYSDYANNGKDWVNLRQPESVSINPDGGFQTPHR